jgi:hypothetical protein
MTRLWSNSWLRLVIGAAVPLLVLVLAVCWHWRSHAAPAPMKPAPAKPRHPHAEAMEPFLAAMKRGDKAAAFAAYTEFTRQHPGGFDRWLGSVLTKGKSRREDVIRIFGTHFKDLDRPERDKLLTLQYEIYLPGSWGHEVYLVFHFDAVRGTLTLTEWSRSFAICGFCPHVFAWAGWWRLEGKMLAGCVGRRSEGIDTLLLPRLRTCDGRLRLKLANLAPEVEHIDQVEAGCFPLREGEEADVAWDGTPIAWRASRSLQAPMRSTHSAEEGFSLDLDPEATRQVVVLEAFNTSRFEQVMREALRQGREKEVAAGLSVRFDQGTAIEVQPVGTKFLRRIAIRVPPRSRSVRLSAPADLWFIRRVWTGSGREVEKTIRWHSPTTVKGPVPDARRLLSHADKQYLRLAPGQEAEVMFSPEPRTEVGRWGFALRMRGFYEFLPGVR